MGQQNINRYECDECKKVQEVPTDERRQSARPAGWMKVLICLERRDADSDEPRTPANKNLYASPVACSTACAIALLHANAVDFALQLAPFDDEEETPEEASLVIARGETYSTDQVLEVLSGRAAPIKSPEE